MKCVNVILNYIRILSLVLVLSGAFSLRALANCESDLSVCINYADELEIQNNALKAANSILVEQRNGAYKKISELEENPLLPGWATIIVGGAAGCGIGTWAGNSKAGCISGLAGSIIGVFLR